MSSHEYFKHPDILNRKHASDEPNDESEIDTLTKKWQRQTSQTTLFHLLNETPLVTPRTEVRYSIQKGIVSKLTKWVAAFSNLVELVTLMINWGIQRGAIYTDKELGEMLNEFVDQIVVLSPLFN